MDVKAIILDVDQTLTGTTPSWLQFTELIGADVSEHERIYNDFINGEIDYKNAKEQLIDLWRKRMTLSRSNIKEVFSKIDLRDYAKEAVEYLSSKHKVCIISGTIDSFVELVASEIGVSDYYSATKFIFDKNDNLIDFEYTTDRGEKKLVFLNIFCKENNLEYKDICAIGDGESDSFLFEKVGIPILFINDETELELKNKYPLHLSRWLNIYDYF